MFDLQAYLARASDDTIFALYRCAKARAYFIFRDPKKMIALRNEKEKLDFLKKNLDDK